MTLQNVPQFIAQLQKLAPAPGGSTKHAGSAKSACLFYGCSYNSWVNYRTGKSAPPLDKALEWAKMAGLKISVE